MAVTMHRSQAQNMFPSIITITIAIISVWLLTAFGDKEVLQIIKFLCACAHYVMTTRYPSFLHLQPCKTCHNCLNLCSQGNLTPMEQARSLISLAWALATYAGFDFRHLLSIVWRLPFIPSLLVVTLKVSAVLVLALA
jgi:hypothetical protein